MKKTPKNSRYLKSADDRLAGLIKSLTDLRQALGEGCEPGYALLELDGVQIDLTSIANDVKRSAVAEPGARPDSQPATAQPAGDPLIAWRAVLTFPSGGGMTIFVKAADEIDAKNEAKRQQPNALTVEITPDERDPSSR